VKDAARLLPGRFFLACGGRAVFQGVLRKRVFLVWCFCGEVVVDHVVNGGALMAVFGV
jgi:hypothetical protein